MTSYNSSTTPITGGPTGAFPDGYQSLGSAEAITPIGSSQATGQAITKAFAVVTGADGTKAVVLPAINAIGQMQMVYSATATNGLPIYPASGGAFNGGSANAAITIEGKTLAIFVASSLTNWAAIYTAN